VVKNCKFLLYIIVGYFKPLPPTKQLMTNRTTYQPPVNKLLTLGKQQCDYITELGLGLQHVPDLMKMAVDNELLGADSNSTEFWAAIHAWRALGQLRVEDAIALLLPLFDLEDKDAVAEEMPKVYGTIGEKAIPQLQAYLGERSHGLLKRTTAINSLEEIANQYPNTRNNVVVTLANELKAFNQNSAELNGFIISSLINLQAKESASLIKYTFDAGLVAEDIAGSWNDVRESLGIDDNNDLEEFQPETVEVTVEPVEEVEVVEEATTPFAELHQDKITVEPVEKVITANETEVVQAEVVEEATLVSTELHQDNSTVEPAEAVISEDELLEVEVVEKATSEIQEVTKVASEIREESILSDIKSPEKLSSDDVTSIATAKEENKGFGGAAIKKEKTKGNKKKKPNFTDL
jgi:Protein of unknown function (DUF1186)